MGRPSDPSITKYQVSSDDGGSWADIPDSHPMTTTHTVTGLTNGTAYTFAVRAVNGNGIGKSSRGTATPAAVPLAPANLIATAGDASVILSWSNPNDSSITGYKVSTNGGTNFIDITGLAGSASSFTVTERTGAVGNLVNGTTYNIALRAVNATGDGPPSYATGDGPPSYATGTPTDQDEQVTITFDQSSYRVAEGGSIEVVLTATLTKGTSTANGVLAEVSWAGTATANNDYTPPTLGWTLRII